MKEAIIVLALFVTFAFGFIVVAKVNKLIEKEKQQIASNRKQNKLKICVAVEWSAPYNRIAPIVKEISAAAPQTDVILVCGEASRISERLSDETVDIALLSKSDIAALDKNCEYVFACYDVSKNREAATEKTFDGLIIAWNKTAQSKERDRIIFLLQEEINNK